MVYGFLVMDYSFQGLVFYRKIAQATLTIASAVARDELSSVLNLVLEHKALF